jgi:hypothetical protein
VIIVIGQMIGWRTWVRPWIQLRREVGAYHALMRELEQEDQRGFKNFVRIHEVRLKTERLELSLFSLLRQSK